MELNEKSEQRRVVIDSPGARREVITERTQRGPNEGGPSTGMIALVAVLALGVIGVVFTSARAALTGTAHSESTKERAERLVKSVRGVKSVDNKIYVAGV